MPTVPHDQRLALWQGDMCRLQTDAVVNAANSELLGCFYPNHGCIDNAIHTAAGIRLRQTCYELMQYQGCPEPVGKAKITPGFNLPAKYVIHTVGPITDGTITDKQRCALASCYRSCLHLAAQCRLRSLAFCCISCGEYRFPRREAAAIAVKTVRECLDNAAKTVEKVVFNVYTDEDCAIYKKLLEID